VRTSAPFAALVIAIAACGPQAAPPSASPAASPRDLGREVLPANDGFAAATSGTTGGSKADAAHTKTASDRQQLVAALGDPTDATPKLVYVSGTIDANVDDGNKPLRCEDYAAAGYTLDAYLKAYDPATFGRTKRPSGALEDARAASQKKQVARVQIKVPPNTTVVGRAGARLVGVNLVVETDNVIIRGLTFADAFDCFPQWDPTDGAQGNWNSQYDNISLNGATHVWIDHNAFSDGDHPDAKQPTYLGRPYQIHDGAIDIAKAADLITVSWNRFADHDKLMLIGSSDTAAADVGKLSVTIHHNLFTNVGQRAPRVRFGKVHVFDNVYEVPTAQGYTYTWGVGIDAKLYVDNNVIRTGAGIGLEKIIRVFSGKAIHVSATLLDDGTSRSAVDPLDAYNRLNDPKLVADVGWTPTYVAQLDRVTDVAALVDKGAGPGR
jgi:pectate lyase